MGKAELEADRSSNESSQAAVKSAIEVAEGKITRLEDAYDACHHAKDVAKRKYDNILDVEDECRLQFAGLNAEKIYLNASEGELGGAYENYIATMDKIMEKINNEIYEQKKIRNEKYGILEGLVSAWNWLTTQITNWVD